MGIAAAAACMEKPWLHACQGFGAFDTTDWVVFGVYLALMAGVVVGAFFTSRR